MRRRRGARSSNDIKNVDVRTIESFGAEWSRFDQGRVPEAELRDRFEEYFHVFPWQHLSAGAEGFDLGCGSGRWARFVAPVVGRLHCIDPSPLALDAAKRHLADLADSCVFHLAAANDMPLANGSMDFGYSLGVLHHLPDPEEGLRVCVSKLKVGAPFLLYVYYALDDRPAWYRAIFRGADVLRRVVQGLPDPLKRAVATLAAALIYWPLSRLARFVEVLGRDPEGLPLAYYRRLSFYTLRTDARDRLGTPLEHRFKREEVDAMMRRSGLQDIEISDRPPFWCAVGIRAG